MLRTKDLSDDTTAHPRVPPDLSPLPSPDRFPRRASKGPLPHIIVQSPILPHYVIFNAGAYLATLDSFCKAQMRRGYYDLEESGDSAISTLR